MNLLIRGATVYDGSGGAGAQQDVAVRGERITAVGTDASTLPGAPRVIDAGGLALAPGFIDIHSHADHTLPAFPRASNSITQGEQARSLGPLQRAAGFHIDFAHRSFRWSSEARGAAVVRGGETRGQRRPTGRSSRAPDSGHGDG